MGIRTLCGVVGAFAVAGMALAQDHKSSTSITINDDGNRRHIVVVKDGKVVRDEWVDSKKGDHEPFIFSDGENGSRVTSLGGKNYRIVSGGAQGRSVTTTKSGDGVTIHWKDEDGKEHSKTIKDGQGSPNVSVSSDHGQTIVRFKDADGKERTKTFQGAGGTSISTENGHTVIRYKDANGKEQTKTFERGGSINLDGGEGDPIIRYRDGNGKAQAGTIIGHGGTNYRVTRDGGKMTIHYRDADGKERTKTIDSATSRNGVQLGSGSQIYTPGNREGVTFGSRSRMSSDDITRLMNSLTPSQRDQQDRQGYLRLDDLTPVQRKMFSAPKGNDWSVSYQIGFNKLTIKSR